MLLQQQNNKKFLKTTETAQVLQLSVSTVRRLADSGKLKCNTMSSNHYRLFEYKDVVAYKNRMFKKKNATFSTQYEQMNLFSANPNKHHNQNMKNIRAKSHPAHYLMHKYWGRKPHNVVREYIDNYTNPGDIVLDPFMGSGVVPIEAIKNNRRSIGIDINPMSRFIVSNSVMHVSLDEYEEIANTIISELSDTLGYLYDTSCPICGQNSTLEVAVWDHDVLSRIKGKCPEHGTFIKSADSDDKAFYNRIIKQKRKLDVSKDISYPTDNVLKYVKRSGKKTLDELFSERALIILSKLRDKIEKVSNPKLRDLLLFTFTSMLANVSSMLPGDLKKATYKSGWVISKFWVPKVHTERNIFHCFRLRIRAIIKGKKELQGINPEMMNLFVQDSEQMQFIENNSIDYIFTDPPYGESIAYLALSQFWNSWLEHPVDYNDEIIIDPYRNKNYRDYGKRMLNIFKEMYRVLKNRHYLSFTFNNRDLNVWKNVMDAVRQSGFILKNITLQEQAVSSGTQGINQMNTLTGDFVYTVYKDTNHKIKSRTQKIESSKKYIKDKIASIINSNEGITPTKLYELLIPDIIHNNAYLDNNGNAIDIEKILKNDYEYVSLPTIHNKIGESYQWVPKK